LACEPNDRDLPRLDCVSKGESLASFIAVGDTGEPPPLLGLLDPARAVSEAIDREQLRKPVDAFLLLGDNFYPSGLSKVDLAARLRMNVVRPFCRFLSLSGPHGPELASDCPIDEQARTPRPVIAVLGNHDDRLPESADLERGEVPQWIPEWEMPAGVAEVYELPGSLSVIAIDSVHLRQRADPGSIVDALRRARGDWRVLIAHHPFSVTGEPWDDRYLARVEDAIHESGVTVHLMLTGHEHLLAAAIPGIPGISLQLIAGSGSHARPRKSELLGEVFELVQPGFVRVDLAREGDRTLLHAALIATASAPYERWTHPHVVACYSVDVDGRVHGGPLDGDSQPAE